MNDVMALKLTTYTYLKTPLKMYICVTFLRRLLDTIAFTGTKLGLTKAAPQTN